ncbi:MAG: TonB-dependent receptor [Sphingomonas sp.]|uniref:TonB-dependent receptor n=1 Tax=Sphingomonas sp. TaxID=28214 RepID=UPI000DBBF2F3|nr:TonB-dependent receptor [Sphingomonas sp.]PZU79617.1 MAG: TonB-dependent receptor [Sphingomonas sp.]
MKYHNVAVGCLLVIAAPAVAQHGDHPRETEDIVVTARGQPASDMLGGVSVLGGTDLDAARRTSLGETLAGLPGVSATSFGPSASRPILRGFQGDRIRVLTDGIGSFDASASSVDHPVAINPLLAQRIEVLRGPASLLYGSAAIGGVVNALTTRIPRSVPEDAIHIEGDLEYGSAAKERRATGIVDVPLGGGFVTHLDASYARYDDLRTGGYVLSRPLREAASLSASPAIRELARLRGRIPNTSGETQEYGAGIAYIDAGGSLGISAGRTDNRYGVPIRFSLDPAREAEAPTIDARQDRFDVRAEITPASGTFQAIRFRGGFGDYRHVEIEESGEIATSFLNTGMEGRVEFVQREQGRWGGTSGAQILTRDFRVIGAEAFLPPTSTEQGGVFTVQHLEIGAARLEAGARYERTTAAARGTLSDDAVAVQRRFNAFSESIGGSLRVSDGVRAGINLTHAERAPTVEELYANGPHLATQAFEVGDPTLRLEKSNGAELSLRTEGGVVRVQASAYYNRFSRFIYQAPTGEVSDELSVYAVRAADAEQWGMEGEIDATIARIGAGRIKAEAMADYVRVTLKGIGPAPFIPPMRVRGAVGYTSPLFDMRTEVEHVTRQSRIASIETPTDAFTLVNARGEWRPGGRDGMLALRLVANNLLDVTARRHSSMLKDYAPLAGRDIRVGVGLHF